jgi:hypothetical protein
LSKLITKGKQKLKIEIISIIKIKANKLMLFRSLVKNSFATLVLAEHNGKRLSSNTLKVLTATSKLKDKQHILVFAEDEKEVVASIKDTVPADIL